ncbi:MAG TPA: phosphotransferase [Candidatus Cryosericum sp.]|nr:phosphotransferase [Candidatus Cryosericum sp.]
MEEHIGSAQLLARGRTAEVYAWGKDSVLKLFVPGYPASFIDQEEAGTRAAQAAGLPSPRLQDTLTLDGRRGLVLERVQGSSMLRLVEREPAHTGRYARQFAELQARIHDVHAPGLTSRREDLARRIARAGVVAVIKGDALATLERLPEDDHLCHCDFHPANVLMTPAGPRVIDWSLAAGGAPASDAACTALLLRIADASHGDLSVTWVERETRERFYRAWLAKYKQLQPEAAQQMWSWMLPVAVARVADDIPGERERLMPLIDELRAARGARSRT